MSIDNRKVGEVLKVKDDAGFYEGLVVTRVKTEPFKNGNPMYTFSRVRLPSGEVVRMSEDEMIKSSEKPTAKTINLSINLKAAKKKAFYNGGRQFVNVFGGREILMRLAQTRFLAN